MLHTENQSIFQGPVVKTLFFLSLPILAGMVFDLLYQVVDTYFLSLIDKGSTSIISGVGIIFPLFFLIIAITHGLMTGISTISAIAIGAKDSQKIKTAASTGLALSIIGGLVLTLILFLFFDELIEGLAGNKLSSNALMYAKQYMWWIIFSPVILFSSHVFVGILQGEGRTMQMGIAFGISTLVNIILDPILIFYFNMGVPGAAIATLIAFFSVNIYVLILFKRSEGGLSHYFSTKSVSLTSAKEIFSLSFPQSMRMLTIGLYIMVFNYLVSSIGENEMNAFVLVGRIDHIVLTPIIAFSVGLSTMLGQNFGRKNFERVRKIYSKGLIFILGITIFITILYMVFAKVLFSSFTDIPEVLDFAVRQVITISLFFAIGSGVEITVSSVFQAVKKPFYSLLLILVRFGVFAIPLAIIFTKYIGNNVENIWYALALAQIMGAIFSYIWLKNYLKKKLQPI